MPRARRERIRFLITRRSARIRIRDIRCSMQSARLCMSRRLRSLRLNVPFLVKVSICDLNIRKGPGTDYDRVQFIPIGVYTIMEVRAGKGSKAGWGRLKSGIDGSRWISSVGFKNDGWWRLISLLAVFFLPFFGFLPELSRPKALRKIEGRCLRMSTDTKKELPWWRSTR